MIAFICIVASSHAQVSIDVGASTSYGVQRYVTSKAKVPEDCVCGNYDRGDGHRRDIGLEGNFRVGLNAPVSLIASVGLAVYNQQGTWLEEGAELPGIDAGIGEVVKTTTEHRLQYLSTGLSLVAGVGMEYGSFHIIPLVRFSSAATASTVNGLYLTAPNNAVMDPTLVPNAEYAESGRAIIFERIPIAGHKTLSVDVGATFGYRVKVDALGIPLVSIIHIYGLTGLGSIHNYVTTTRTLELGGRLLVGVGF